MSQDSRSRSHAAAARRFGQTRWRTADKWYRRLTAPWRTLPDFLIVGAMKAGTTTLYDILARHPQVRPAAFKEVHYFDLRFTRGLSWYRRHFPLAHHLRSGATGSVRYCTGEATPSYMFHPLAPERIKAALPNIALIAVLRNPIDRAYSHYQYQRNANGESRSFDEAVRSEMEQLASCREALLHDPAAAVPYTRHAYLGRGFYVNQIQRLFSLFGRNRVLVLSSEDLFTRADSVYAETLAFLNLEPHPLAAVTPRNQGSYATPLDAAVRGALARYFEPHNNQLYELLDRDFRWN